MQEFITYTYIIHISAFVRKYNFQAASNSYQRRETIRRKPTQKTTILTNRSLLKISILQQCPFNRKRLGKVMEQSKNMSSFWKVLLLLEGHRICLSTLLLLWRPCYAMEAAVRKSPCWTGCLSLEIIYGLQRAKLQPTE